MLVEVIKKGDIIKTDTTINGHDTFVVVSLDPLHIKYHATERTYEYDMLDLISVNRFTGEYDFEVIGNIYSEN